jgi:iron complex transport system ATP-binding protein
MNNIILKTSRLSVGYKPSYQTICLFENLNLELPPRQLICFMGPNGAGKSTLIRTLAGLQEPLDGVVEIVSSQKADAPVARLVSVVLTDRIMAGNLTVQELITFGRYPYLDWTIQLSEKDEETINTAINEVNVRHLKEKKIFELSDGQLQMVMIARALAQDTPVILLDEPTAHLDLNNRVEIMNLLKRLTRKTDKSILIATHDLDLALQTADSIWLTGKDKDIITGIPEDLVLSGVFDSIFEFKGFDLKTGKVIHTPYQKISVNLSGEGHPYLWTKNALERNGYLVDANGMLDISSEQEGAPKWTIRYKEQVHEVSSIEDLLRYIQTISIPSHHSF